MALGPVYLCVTWLHVTHYNGAWLDVVRVGHLDKILTVRWYYCCVQHYDLCTIVYCCMIVLLELC